MNGKSIDQSRLCSTNNQEISLRESKEKEKECSLVPISEGKKLRTESIVR